MVVWTDPLDAKENCHDEHDERNNQSAPELEKATQAATLPPGVSDAQDLPLVPPTASEAEPTPLSGVLQIDQAQLEKHLDELVRDSVEQTLNALLDAEADTLCGAKRYQRSPERLDTRAGSYTHQMQARVVEVELLRRTVRSRTTQGQLDHSLLS
jgi:hypothetical protein